MEIPDSVDHSQLQMSAIKVKKEIEMLHVPFTKLIA